MKTGDRIVRFGLHEGKLVVMGGLVLNENTQVPGQEVALAFDDGEFGDISTDSAKKLTLEGHCVVCSATVTESAKFCGGCGALNVFEHLDQVSTHLKLSGDRTPPDLQERVVAAAKSRLGTAVAKAKAVPAAA